MDKKGYTLDGYNDSYVLTIVVVAIMLLIGVIALQEGWVNG